MKIGIIGLGLIGGSLAMALAESGKHEILGLDRNRSSLLAAKMVGAVSGELSEDNIGECDMLFIALYPRDTVDFVEKNASKIKKGAIVADCGGVKRPICAPCEKAAEENGIHETALILVGDFLRGTVERSRLYDPGFTTAFREAEK